MDERELERIFGVLGPVLADRSMVLVGGQAVFVWAQRLGLVEAAGSDAGWLASKDIDFEGSAVAARASAKLLGGKARVPSFDHHTPLTAVVFFDDSDGIERRIDFLGAPLGLDRRDVRDTAVDVEIGTGALSSTLWVMHPERVMESRIANVQILGIDDAHALAQLRTSIVIAREWSRFLLADCSIPSVIGFAGCCGSMSGSSASASATCISASSLLTEGSIRSTRSWRTMTGSRRRSASVATRRCASS